MAVVVSKTSHPPGAESVIAWARERIASFKAPKRIEFVSALPRNASGKILRRDLRARFRASS
jgi:acyl-coenzyme A synthetase/AMP-(fatty) acid ligase